ncbi:MAG: hypothetical protein MZV49_07925 [Rhodopseudomonas palustris]|nr:hypothetical protein [Rhodopseudomonas palustris]
MHRERDAQLSGARAASAASISSLIACDGGELLRFQRHGAVGIARCSAATAIGCYVQRLGVDHHDPRSDAARRRQRARWRRRRPGAAAMNGRVVAVLVKAGDRVERRAAGADAGSDEDGARASPRRFRASFRRSMSPRASRSPPDGSSRRSRPSRRGEAAAPAA